MEGQKVKGRSRAHWSTGRDARASTRTPAPRSRAGQQ